MVKELIIDSTPNKGVTIALLQDKQLVELNNEQMDDSFSVGDIYMGKIKKIMPGLNAAFVDVGYEKDAFLHYLDLGPQVRSLLKLTRIVKNSNYQVKLLQNLKLEKDIDKAGKISEVLSRGLVMPVQIAKEPISTKGPRLSSDLSFAGRFVVLVPFSNVVSISKKIKGSQERNRLKKIVDSIKPNNVGVIIRTVSEGKGVEELQKDLNDLISKWERFVNRLHEVDPPQRVFGEMDRASTILRDMLTDEFTHIYVNDEQIYEETRSYIKEISPDLERIVKLHKSKKPIFDQYGINKQIKASFGKTVTLPGGAYLIIEHTEALHVIDVNSGNRVSNKENQEENALLVNKEAAKEIARQLRLRDMGGIVVIDFIDMHHAANRRELYNFLKSCMSGDRARHTILPPSKFGLVQITRQRVRPEMNVTTSETCPSCKGTGKIRPSIVLMDDIENNLSYILREQNEKNITVFVHPYIATYIKSGFISKRLSWLIKFGKWIKVKSNTSYYLTEFKFYNSRMEEIKI